MISGKAKVCIATLVILVFGPTMLRQRSEIARLRTEKATLLPQAQEAEQLLKQNRRLSQANVDTNEITRLRERHHELLRLRGQVGLLEQAFREKLKNPEAPARSNSTVMGAWEQNRIRKTEDLHETLERNTLKENGSSTPLSALETVLWAITSGRFDHLTALRWDASGSQFADQAEFRARIEKIAGYFEGVSAFRVVRSIEYGNGRVNIIFALDRQTGHLEGQPLSGGIWIRSEDQGWKVENIYVMNDAF